MQPVRGTSCHRDPAHGWLMNCCCKSGSRGAISFGWVANTFAMVSCPFSDRKPRVPFDVPVMPALQEAIDAMPAGNRVVFLVTSHGKQFTAAEFRKHLSTVVQRSRITEAVHLARPAENGGNTLGGPQRDHDGTHGVVRLEDCERSQAS